MRSIIYGPMLGRIRIGIVFDVFVYIFRGARYWAISWCRPAFLTSDSREMAFSYQGGISGFWKTKLYKKSVDHLAGVRYQEFM